LLAEAARQWILPLATLSGAAVAERLPTMRASDRHLVYSATIGEGIERGVLRSMGGHGEEAKRRSFRAADAHRRLR
jgi:hypothetical protein